MSSNSLEDIKVLSQREIPAAKALARFSNAAGTMLTEYASLGVMKVITGKLLSTEAYPGQIEVESTQDFMSDVYSSTSDLSDSDYQPSPSPLSSHSSSSISMSSTSMSSTSMSSTSMSSTSLSSATPAALFPAIFAGFRNFNTFLQAAEDFFERDKEITDSDLYQQKFMTLCSFLEDFFRKNSSSLLLEVIALIIRAEKHNADACFVLSVLVTSLQFSPFLQLFLHKLL